MSRPLIAIFLMAMVTYLPRVIPITLFRSQRQSKFLTSFLYYVPYAVLGSMIFPDILNSTPHYLSALVGGTVAVILSLFGRSLMTAAIFSVAAVYMAEIFLKL